MKNREKSSEIDLNKILIRLISLIGAYTSIALKLIVYASPAISATKKLIGKKATVSIGQVLVTVIGFLIVPGFTIGYIVSAGITLYRRYEGKMKGDKNENGK